MRSSCAIVCLLAFAACGRPGSTTTFDCDPKCPSGQRCTETGCVLEASSGGEDDMAVAPADDLAARCNPPCTGATPVCGPAGICVACATDGDCPMGMQCAQVGRVTTCLPGCKDDSRCGGGTRMCCGGLCVDTSQDAMHCGACARPCAGQHGSGRCQDGTCVPGSCSAGWDDCNRDPADGCETRLNADPNHCNGCGRKCALPNAVSGCSAPADDNPSGCYLRACMFGFADCNENGVDGCEKSTLSDSGNCGGCGVACRVTPNSRPACRNANCVLDSCNNNFADCDGVYNNGCETAIMNDAKNCGGCGKACPLNNICVGGACTCPQCNNLFPNAAAKCVNNMCVFDACHVGYGDCDFNIQNGCERNLSGDAKSCGACGAECPVQAPYCLGGKCSNVLKSCYAVKQADGNSADGIYTIDPDGDGGNPSFSIYCEMTTDGGGWDVIAYLRANAHWDWKFYSDNGAVGDVGAGFSSGVLLRNANSSYNEKIVIYRNLVENNISLGKQFNVVRRMDNAAIQFSTLEGATTGWGFRESFGMSDANAGNICTHGCATYRGHGMFHDHTGIQYHGTQGGNNGCRDGNNICWMSRGLGCNVGASRCAYLSGNGEGVVYGVRNK